MKEVNKFFLEYLPKKEGLACSLCALWLSNYYLEVEGSAFDSNAYASQDERVEAMFPGMPEDTLNLIKLKAYKHRSDHHGEKKDERITELTTMVAETEYEIFMVAVWWNH